MPSTFFLAQTALEFPVPLPEGANKAWMACHFSSYGTGLSNLPVSLPAGSMVIVNDRIPIFGHDPGRVASELLTLTERFQISHIFLDFQRPGNKETASVVRAIIDALPCSIGVSEAYAREAACAVCLGPVPPHLGVAEWISPWEGRPIWLEVAPVCRTYAIGEGGCIWEDVRPGGKFPHWDEKAKCHYRIEISKDIVRFTLQRGSKELELLRNTEGIECFVGLYQEFAQPEAQDTALTQ
jgi:hypothetical protein